MRLLIPLSLVACIAFVNAVLARDTVSGGSSAEGLLAALSIEEPATPDFVLPPPYDGEGGAAGRAAGRPTNAYMAGDIVYSVVFVESSGGTGNCAPADVETEDWTAQRRRRVLSEIDEGMQFWLSRSDRPRLNFVLDDLGVQPTSCEPILRIARGEGSAQGKWVADVLASLGVEATEENHVDAARSFVDDRRQAFDADWGFLIFVVDSYDDVDGRFAGGSFAYAYLNGPFMVTTYDNGGWGIASMDRIVAHEVGHLFGALDEHRGSGCSVADSWGYLNAANTSCNVDGDTGDVSIMGEASEIRSSSVDVSRSARHAVGWRNPEAGLGETVVDVVRTSAVVSLTQDDTVSTDGATPLITGAAGNIVFEPEGPRMVAGREYGRSTPVSIARLAAVEWSLDGGAFSSDGVSLGEPAGDDYPYSFQPPSPLAAGEHSVRVRAVNDFGHASAVAKETFTVLTDDALPTPTSVSTATPRSTPTPTRTRPPATSTPTPVVPVGSAVDRDGDGCPDKRELGPDERLGGRRDPTNPWDFFDPTGDGRVRIADIRVVISQLGVDAGRPGYTEATDRSLVGPNRWNLGPPDGRQRGEDILLIFAQFGHDCA